MRPSTVITSRATGHPQDALQAPTAAQSKIIALRRYDTALALTKERLRATQRPSKHDFDLRVKVITHLQEGDMVFLDTPPKTKENGADTTRTLAPNTSGRYCIFRFYPDTVAIEVDGLRTKYRVTKVPRSTPLGDATPYHRRLYQTALLQQAPPRDPLRKWPNGLSRNHIGRYHRHRRRARGKLAHLRWYRRTHMDPVCQTNHTAQNDTTHRVG